MTHAELTRRVRALTTMPEEHAEREWKRLEELTASDRPSHPQSRSLEVER